jgi:predicted TIM-barrel fold metal-dependent hydrolase
MRIDAHIHYTPPTMAQDLAGFAEREPYWGLLITPDPVNHTEQGWATPERTIADMDLAGLDKVVLLGVYRQTQADCVATNDEALAIVQRWPDRVVAFAVVQPKAGPKAVDEIRRCLEAGMRGVGEMNPYGSGYSLDDPDFLRLVETCIDYDVPLNLHVSEEIGHFYLGKSTTPLIDYYRLACRYPELKLILAHWGGGLLFYEIMPEVRHNLRNVWYDLAGTPLLYPTDAIMRLGLQCVSHKKLLYGSDYPLLICPDKQREPDFRPFIAEIDALHLSPEVQADLMGDNAARLLGFAPAEPRPALGPEQFAPAPILTEVAQLRGQAIGPYMAVRAVTQAWPETRSVFDRNNIPWNDSPVPFWEPIAQAAAARGMGPARRQRLLNELNEVISGAGGHT